MRERMRFENELENLLANENADYLRNEADAGGYLKAGSDLTENEFDPVLSDLAEKIVAREMSGFEYEKKKPCTKCFSAADIEKVKKAYEDNTTAANANSGDRCSCIVMLNVALGQLLPLLLVQNRARSSSSRIVSMGKLPTETIEKMMKHLRGKGFADYPKLFNFFDRRKRTAGTLKPEKLKSSVQAKILSMSKKEGCWFAYTMSIMDGYHSVLLLVDKTTPTAKIYWLDQFSSSINDDVTNTLDQLLLDKTQRFWQGVMDTKNKGYNTIIRLWALKKC